MINLLPRLEEWSVILNRLEHAKPCTLHPSKLTFEACTKCGEAVCQKCKSKNGMCTKCEVHASKHTSRWLNRCMPSKTNTILALIIPFLFVLLVIVQDKNKPTQKVPIISTENTKPDTSPPKGPQRRIPRKASSFHLSNKILGVNKVMAIHAPFHTPHGYPYELVPDFFNPPFQVVPYQLPISGQTQLRKITHKIQPPTELAESEKPNEEETLYHCPPYRNPGLYPYAMVPDILNPPFLVVPQSWPPPKSNKSHLDQGESEVRPAQSKIMDTNSILPRNKEFQTKQASKSNSTVIPPTDNSNQSSIRKASKVTRKRINRKPKRITSNTMADHLLGGNKYQKYHLESIPTKSKIITLSFDGDHLDNCVKPILDILKTM